MYRINELLKLDRKLYHTNDLALLWGIVNRNTLYTTIKRYVQKGVLIPVYKGLYSTVPITELDPLQLGISIIHRYAYLSTETVLAQAGIISQAVYGYTYISDCSRKVTLDSLCFVYRQLQDRFLYNTAGIAEQEGVFIASSERAIADMLYFNPKYHFDVLEMVDFQKVRSIQEEVGYL